MLSIQREQVLGQTVNIRDGRLVTRKEFIGAIADFLKVPQPRSVPEWVARSLVPPIEGWARLRSAGEAPMLTQARIKFMTLNLEFLIEKAQSLLGYNPQVDFQEGIKESLSGLVATDDTSETSAAA
jgi:nucleoside-diphosphate-sugar epimerase